MISKTMSKFPFYYFQLNAIREEYGLKDEDMAKIIGIDPSTYSMKKRGFRRWSSDEMYAVCKRFNRTVEGLFWPKADN